MSSTTYDDDDYAHIAYSTAWSTVGAKNWFGGEFNWALFGENGRVGTRAEQREDLVAARVSTRGLTRRDETDSEDGKRGAANRGQRPARRARRANSSALALTGGFHSCNTGAITGAKMCTASITVESGTHITVYGDANPAQVSSVEARRWLLRSTPGSLTITLQSKFFCQLDDGPYVWFDGGRFVTGNVTNITLNHVRCS